jgi:hypothetical protein
MNNRFHLSIHGSRSLKDERVKIIILEEIRQHNPTAIVTHAEPGGVCEVARSICREHAIPLKLHFLNYKYLRGAFEHRSKAVIADSDHSVFIHDGKSKGTANELKLAKKMGVSHSEYTLDPPQYEASIGFPVDGDWDVGLLEMKDLIDE